MWLRERGRRARSVSLQLCQALLKVIDGVLLILERVLERREPVTQPALSDKADDGQHERQRADEQREEYQLFHKSEKEPEASCRVDALRVGPASDPVTY
jgi:hypothetical protein